ncbi:MAG: DUF3450 family protein [Planctomycetota bacterium]
MTAPSPHRARGPRARWALVPAVFALAAAGAQEATRPAGDGEDARRVHELVDQLRAARQERAARERDQAAAIARLDAQVSDLRADLEDLERDGREATDDALELAAEIDAARARSDRARAWIALARASAERIAAAVPGATALPTGDDPRATVRAIEALMTRAGDLLSTSRAIELTNEPVPLDGGDRRVHAWILRIGAVGTIFVSEDGEDVGVREGEAWRTDLTADEREAVREAIAIARGRRRPALTPVPLSLEGA